MKATQIELQPKKVYFEFSKEIWIYKKFISNEYILFG